MPVIHVSRGLRGAARAAAAVAVAAALLAGIPGPATAAPPTAAPPAAAGGTEAAGTAAPAAGTAAPAAPTAGTALSPAEVQALKARLRAAIEPCSARVPRNDPVAFGQCAVDLAVPDPVASPSIIHFIYTFLYCLWLQWPYGPDSLYPSVGSCMEVHGY